MTRGFALMIIFLVSVSAKSFNATERYYTEKVITVLLSETGKIIIGTDTLTTDQMRDELQKRLWKSYLGTGKMYDAIHLEMPTNVDAGLVTNTKKAIQEAQRKALIDVCLQKHEKLFEDLSSRQQEKIKKQFPVLFQQDF